MILVPDYSKTESLLVLNCHHAVCDGVSTLVVAAAMSQDGYKRENFPSLLPEPSLMMQIMKYLSIPAGMQLALKALRNIKEKPNYIFNPVKLTGERRVAFSNKINISYAKSKLRDHQLSINDLLMATLSFTLSEFIRDPEHVSICVPFTLKDFPE